MNKAEFKNEIYNLCKENKYNPANLFLEIDKLIDDFSKTQTTKGGQVDLLVIPKIAETKLTDIKIDEFQFQELCDEFKIKETQPTKMNLGTTYPRNRLRTFIKQQIKKNISNFSE